RAALAVGQFEKPAIIAQPTDADSTQPVSAWQSLTLDESKGKPGGLSCCLVPRADPIKLPVPAPPVARATRHRGADAGPAHRDKDAHRSVRCPPAANWRGTFPQPIPDCWRIRRR